MKLEEMKAIADARTKGKWQFHPEVPSFFIPVEYYALMDPHWVMKNTMNIKYLGRQQTVNLLPWLQTTSISFWHVLKR